MPEPHTPTTDEVRSHYAVRFPDVHAASADFDRMIEAVRQEERERCARIAESLGADYRERIHGEDIATRIRAAVPAPEPTEEKPTGGDEHG